MDKLSVKYLLYANDQVILASSAWELLEMANVRKTMIIVFENSESETECNINIENERTEQVYRRSEGLGSFPDHP
ncbi:hypothetical protein EVAR_95034_1 [Eumeta japonica]|uniref:Reverse transcriptase domain-containing protein n=1 Tax=Eumeta variegata TaxID=151549 RepID=A0A4C1VW08_EUMVA|nr:hypothetical protein EVAR_95034_1 [Eumeta japonica]